MITYNQIIETIENIIIKHKQLGENHFFFGEPYNLRDLDLLMPHIILQPIPITLGKDYMKYKFKLYIFDIIDNDLTNSQDVYSDAILIFNDIFNLLNYGEYQDDIFLETELVLNPFEEKFDDLTTGWWVDLIITTNRDDNKCIAPSN